MLRKNLLLLIFLTSVFLFWFVLAKDNFFHWDDWTTFSLFNSSSLNFILKPYAGHFIPLNFLVIYSLFKMFGLNYIAFLIPTLIFHILNTFILYLIVLKQTGNKKIALLSIPVFGISAVYLDVLIYIQLNMVLSACFIFLAYYLYLRFNETKRNFFIFLSATFLIISPLLHEYGILMPFAFSVVAVIRNKQIKKNITTTAYFLTGLINLSIYSFFSAGQTTSSHIFSFGTMIKIVPFVFVGVIRGLILRFVYPGLHLIQGHQYIKTGFFLVLFTVVGIVVAKFVWGILADRKTRERKIREFLIYVILIIAGYTAAAIGRSDLGLAQGSIPRYTYQPFFFLVILLAYFLKDYISRWKLILSIYLVLLVFNIYAVINFENSTPKAYAKRDRQFLSDVNYIFKNNSTIYDFPAAGIAPNTKISSFWFEIPERKKINFVSSDTYYGENCRYCADNKTKEIYQKFLKEYQQKLD